MRLTEIPWSDIKGSREEVKKLYPSIHRVPLLYGTKKEILRSIVGNMEGKVLDIGAGDRFAAELLGGGVTYKSVDTDASRFHDHCSLDGINERFDLVLLLDVLEHLPLTEGGRLLERSMSLLNPGGRIVITIPNNLHPTAFGGDCTHVTSYRYHDLGGLVLSAGFKRLEIFRVSAKRKVKHRALSYFLKPVLKFLDIDFATGILLIARKD